MKRNILIGGAWPYANYLLHIGHLSALLPGDVIARYYRGNGDNVVYVSGTDSHGTPITQRAKKENKTPEQIASFYHEEFKKSFLKAEFSYDYLNLFMIMVIFMKKKKMKTFVLNAIYFYLIEI